MSTGASGGRREVTFVKLGGSLITDKERPGTARPEVLGRLVEEIAAARPELRGGLLLGHGSGSFGHVEAARAGFGGGAPGPEGISRTQARARDLHERVCAALRGAGVPVFSIAPSSAAVARGEGAAPAVDIGPAPAALALSAGLVPVVYGDVVLGRPGGAAICSTELALEALVRGLQVRGWRVRRALWLGATEGVYDEGRRVLAEVREEDVPRARRSAGPAAGTDVTGGMAHRLEVALRLAWRGIPSWIGDGRMSGRLEEALRAGPGEVPGTRVPARQRGRR